MLLTWVVPPPGAGPVCQGAPGRAPDSGVGAVGALGAAGAGIPLGSLGLEAAGPIGGAAGGAP